MAIVICVDDMERSLRVLRKALCTHAAMNCICYIAIDGVAIRSMRNLRESKNLHKWTDRFQLLLGHRAKFSDRFQKVLRHQMSR